MPKSEVSTCSIK